MTDVALDFGSVDGCQLAFRRVFGCNPGEYARTKAPIPLFIPYGVKFRELRKETVDMEAERIYPTAKKARPQGDHQAGVRAEEYFTYCEEVGCDVWGLLASMDSLRGEPVCLWMKPPYQKPGTSSYVQGVEAPADYNGPVPETEYLVFQGEPFREEDYAQAILAVEWAMEKYDPTLIGRQWDDKEPRIQLEPRGQRGYIELRAVRPL